MSDQLKENPTIRNYFVDEAGDPTLFNTHGKVLLGKEGCSKFFILGKLDIVDPEKLASELNELRARLMADPYFQGVPSMKLEQRKTAVSFHAKDDLPEVRREVFSLFSRHQLQFFAVVRNKAFILDKVINHRKLWPGYRYHPNQLYDRCVSQLFRERLHKDDGYLITFARRGNSDRTESLDKALQAARASFRQKWGIVGSAPIEIIPASPVDAVCLQAVDYFLWALQRFYERDEDRFLNLVWPQVKLVLDRDDLRDAPTGIYYTQSKPLTLETRAKK